MSRKPSQALREARQRITELEAELTVSVAPYVEKAEQAASYANEERNRRLAIEEEIEAMAHLMLRTEPVIQHVERKMYNPMPPKEVVRKIYYPVPVETIYEHLGEGGYFERNEGVNGTVFLERKPSFFGRIGDRIDRMFKWR